MELNGKILQSELLKALEVQIGRLKQKDINLSIAIVTLGPEETWETYVAQKIKLAQTLGISYRLISLRPKSSDDVLKAISELNDDNTIDGLIVQRPFPTYIDTERVIQSVSNKKDIDGFRKDSLYEVPVFLAVKFLLNHIRQLLNVPELRFWLSNQSILIIGKGETAGKPIHEGFKKMGIPSTVMDTKTENKDELFKNADIIIFATGIRVEVPYELLKKNSILIGIGLHRKEGRLEGDFDENEAKSRVLYYTPSPGGVGPLNLYFLFENLVKATKNA